MFLGYRNIAINKPPLCVAVQEAAAVTPTWLAVTTQLASKVAPCGGEVEVKVGKSEVAQYILS